MKPYFLLAFVLLCIVWTGCRKTENSSVPGNTLPVDTILAKLNGILSHGKEIVGRQICFSAAAVGAKSYSWDLGNGQTSTDSSPCVVYTDQGMYTVTLIINNDTSLKKQWQRYFYRVPRYTYLLNGTRTFKHIRGVTNNGGHDSSFVMPDETLAITYIDSFTVTVNNDTLGFIYQVPQYDSNLYYNRTYSISTKRSRIHSLRLVHTPTADSIFYRIHDMSEAGYTFDYYSSP